MGAENAAASGMIMVDKCGMGLGKVPCLQRHQPSPPQEYPPAGPSQLPCRDRTPPLSSGPLPDQEDLISVVPTSGVALGISDASTLWPPPECMRLAQWYTVDVEGVDVQEEPLAWVNQNSHLGVLAARKVKPIQKKGTIYHMYLLFKDMAKRDLCQSVLVSLLSGKTLLPFLYTDTLVNCFGVCEVRYMQEVYINTVSTAEVQELLAVGPHPYMTPSDAICEMLNYIQYPALLNPRPPPPKHE
ncbi:hypothetical protein BS47DRAFT_1388075 [Hydnum rufescens UP504]|uniref:Uncharacterized protein n=1 Tax=Hydnum rufescens UP504 TaxID=1448309 RepID=A0A9P6DYI1_9AGAM|nr:hypothetical protein BS47DRAFT_1388075 [Hydnum rufescens UP504]